MVRVGVGPKLNICTILKMPRCKEVRFSRSRRMHGALASPQWKGTRSEYACSHTTFETLISLSDSETQYQPTSSDFETSNKQVLLD